MKKPKTQSEAIICYLIAGNKITSIQATQRQFGYCTKLPQRIAEIIELGFSIKKERVNKLSIFGNNCSFVEYSLDFKKTSKKLINNYTN
jgi:hypothetical protein